MRALAWTHKATVLPEPSTPQTHGHTSSPAKDIPLTPVHSYGPTAGREGSLPVTRKERRSFAVFGSVIRELRLRGHRRAERASQPQVLGPRLAGMPPLLPRLEAWFLSASALRSGAFRAASLACCR